MIKQTLILSHSLIKTSFDEYACNCTLSTLVYISVKQIPCTKHLMGKLSLPFFCPSNHRKLFIGFVRVCMCMMCAQVMYGKN